MMLGPNYTDDRGAIHIHHHGGDMFTILMEVELGERAAFDLFHHDDVVFFFWGWFW